MLNEIEVGLICLSERKKFKEVYEEYFTALKYFAMRYDGSNTVSFQMERVDHIYIV